jgi:hypothetical protein
LWTYLISYNLIVCSRWKKNMEICRSEPYNNI